MGAEEGIITVLNDKTWTDQEEITSILLNNMENKISNELGSGLEYIKYNEPLVTLENATFNEGLNSFIASTSLTIDSDIMQSYNLLIVNINDIDYLLQKRDSSIYASPKTIFGNNEIIFDQNIPVICTIINDMIYIHLSEDFVNIDTVYNIIVYGAVSNNYFLLGDIQRQVNNVPKMATFIYHSDINVVFTNPQLQVYYETPYNYLLANCLELGSAAPTIIKYKNNYAEIFYLSKINDISTSPTFLFSPFGSQSMISINDNGIIYTQE